MAKRNGRKKTPRRRRKQGISLLGVAETVALSNAATTTLFNVNAVDFVMGGANFGGQNEVTLRELFNPMQAGMATTLQLQGATQMVTIPLAFRIGKQLARPAISRVNALLRKAGVASTVKV